MKIFSLLCAAAVSLAVATPAMASNTDNFDGFRVGVLAGATGDDFPTDGSDLTYGAAAGYDMAVTNDLLLGVEVDVGDVDNGVSDRAVSVALRATAPVSSKVALFGSVGYTNLSVTVSPNVNVDVDGYRIGGGAELALTKNIYTSLEYRYSDFDLNNFGGNSGTHSVLAGLGLRF